ncbi:MAG: helix-turn-helix domain-containing protein [Candidatus Natronoplasma sp.]
MDKELERAERFLELAPESEVDEYALDKLKKRLYRWKNAKVEYLTDLEYYINGKRFDDLLNAFLEIEDLKKAKIKFLNPTIEGPWNFSKPTKELKEKEGKGVCKTFDYDPTSIDSWIEAEYTNFEKVMVRAFIPDFYAPISIQTKSQYHRAEEVPRQYDPHLKKLKGLWDDIRTGVLPLCLRFSLYTKNERYSILIDPINNKMKPHPLGSISRVDPVDREPIDYMNFDKVLAPMEFPQLVKNILELLFETGRMSIFDIAAQLNMDQNVAKNNLKSLEKEELVKREKDVYYKINMDTVEKVAGEL